MKRAAIAPRVVQCSGNAPAVKDVRLITSIMEPGAKSGFSAITSTGNLNTPGVLQDPDRGTVAFALQVLFTFATGRPRDVDVERAILQSESGFAIGTTWERITKGGWRNDGPPPHEVKYGDDYLVVADAPGVEHLVPIGGHTHKKTFLAQSYPVSYYARFQVNLRYGVPSRIISSIQYDVRITLASEDDMAQGTARALKTAAVYVEPDIRQSSDQAIESIHDLLYRTQRLAEASTSLKFRRT